MTKISFLAIALCLAACENKPAMPSATQNSQLDEAEAMLDEAAKKEKGPDAEAPDPPEITE